MAKSFPSELLERDCHFYVNELRLKRANSIVVTSVPELRASRE